MGNAQPFPFDARVGYWLRMYSYFGHFYEAGVQTLFWDTSCNHDMALGEWTACKDIVATDLRGGTIGSPAIGVYMGSTRAVTVPPTILAMDNSTVLLFAAFGVPEVALALGHEAHATLRLVVLGAFNTTVTLSGGFWTLANQTIRRTIVYDDGSLLPNTKLLWQTPQSGPRSWTQKVVLAVGGAHPLFIFEKLTIKM